MKEFTNHFSFKDKLHAIITIMMEITIIIIIIIIIHLDFLAFFYD